MSTKSKAEIARANGAKSRGPKTPEGREKSSRNALKHGFTARSTVILDCENPEEFQAILQEYVAIHRPDNPAELNLVEEMATCRWRIRRMWAIETSLINNEMKRPQPNAADDLERLALAFRTLADDSRSLALVSRYESRMHRTHERAYATLRLLQQTKLDRQTNPDSPQPIDPQVESAESQGPTAAPTTVPATGATLTDPPKTPTLCQALRETQQVRGKTAEQTQFAPPETCRVARTPINTAD